MSVSSEVALAVVVALGLGSLLGQRFLPDRPRLRGRLAKAVVGAVLAASLALIVIGLLVVVPAIVR